MSETAFVSQLLGDKVVCVALAESTHQLRLFVAVGQEMPLHAAAAARAILAYRRPAFVRKALSGSGLQAFTSQTKTDVDAIMREDAPHPAPGVRRLRERDRPRRLGGGRPHRGRHRPGRGEYRHRGAKYRFSGSAIRCETIAVVQSVARAINSELGMAATDVPAAVAT